MLINTVCDVSFENLVLVFLIRMSVTGDRTHVFGVYHQPQLTKIHQFFLDLDEFI